MYYILTSVHGGIGYISVCCKVFRHVQWIDMAGVGYLKNSSAIISCLPLIIGTQPTTCIEQTIDETNIIYTASPKVAVM